MKISTWHLMAKNSEDLKKLLLLYIKMVLSIRRLPRPWNWAAARWLRPYSSLTGLVPLRTGLAMVDQSWVHVLRIISKGCVWEIDVWVLPALLQRLKGWGVSLSVLRPYAAHCIKLVYSFLWDNIYIYMLVREIDNIYKWLLGSQQSKWIILCLNNAKLYHCI